MGATVRFTPLYGTHTASPAHAYLLAVDGFNFLLDCGWTSAFNPDLVEPLRAHLPSIHAVLLAHPDLAHLGALPYAFAKLGLPANTPVFATLPVWRMGQMFLHDAYRAVQAQRDFDLFSLDDVDDAFELQRQSPRFTLLKYQQHCPLHHIPAFLNNPHACDLAITPHPAGHMLGGAVWNIQKNTENIVFAVHVNHRREHHLSPTTLASFPRPSHLFIGATNSQTHTQSLKTSDLLNPILNTIRNNGNVLIPVDTAGRIIEVAIELSAIWDANRTALTLPGEAHPVPLVVFHDFSRKTFSFARTMIEWMSDAVVKRFDTTRENLFDFKHLQCCTSRVELDALPSPKIVLASSMCLDIGYARDLFLDWAPNPANLVIFVSNPDPDTLARKVLSHLQDSTLTQAPDARPSPPFVLSLTICEKKLLSGDDLVRWREEQRLRLIEASYVAEQKEVTTTSLASNSNNNVSKVPDFSQEQSEGSSPPRLTDPMSLDGSEVGYVPRDAPNHGDPASAVPPSAPKNSIVHTAGNDEDRDKSVDGNDSQNYAIDREEGSGNDDDDDDDDDDDVYDEDLIMRMSSGPRVHRPGQAPLMGGHVPRQAVVGLIPSGNTKVAQMASVIDNAKKSFMRPGSLGQGDDLMEWTSEDDTLGADKQVHPLTSEKPVPAGPTPEGAKNWDDYGQSVSLNRFAIGEDPFAAAEESRDSGQNGEHKDGPHAQTTEKSEPASEEDVPVRYMSRELSLNVACHIVLVDRSGLSEGDALKHLIKEVEPRRVVLVNGTSDDVEHLQGYLQQALTASSSELTDIERGRRKSRMNIKFEKIVSTGYDVGAKNNLDEFAADSVVKAESQAISLPPLEEIPSSSLNSVIFTPRDGQVVDVTSSTSIQRLALEDSLIGDLHWNKVGTSSIAYVSAAIDCANAESTEMKLVAAPNRFTAEMEAAPEATLESSELGTRRVLREFSFVEDSQKQGVLSTRDHPTLTNRDTAGGDQGDVMDAPIMELQRSDTWQHVEAGLPTVFIGSIMLSRLRDAVMRAGITAELAGGILCVENSDTGAVVLVKKVGPQHLVLEGALCEEYYAIRDVLYDELVLVSGT